MFNIGKMVQVSVKEGDLPFHVPGRPDISCVTHYKIFGDLSTGGPPLVVLHGGPGVGHEYLTSFADLLPAYGIPVVFYDQIGCASSTHLPGMAGDKDFWQFPLFLAELDNLLDHLQLRDGPGFHLLGHSWGGMLAAAFASNPKRQRGLQRLVLASGLASTELLIEANQLLRDKLPKDVRDVLADCVAKEDFESPAYKGAATVYNMTYLSRENPPPALLLPAFKHLSEDTTVNKTLIGPSIHKVSGTILGWSSIPDLPKITAPTLIYNAEHDTSHDVTQVPFFELIPRVRWITFPRGSHMCHLEGGGLREKILKVVGDFLTQDI